MTKRSRVVRCDLAPYSVKSQRVRGREALLKFVLSRLQAVTSFSVVSAADTVDLTVGIGEWRASPLLGGGGGWGLRLNGLSSWLVRCCGTWWSGHSAHRSVRSVRPSVRRPCGVRPASGRPAAVVAQRHTAAERGPVWGRGPVTANGKSSSVTYPKRGGGGGGSKGDKC